MLSTDGATCIQLVYQKIFMNIYPNDKVTLSTSGSDIHGNTLICQGGTFYLYRDGKPTSLSSDFAYLLGNGKLFMFCKKTCKFTIYKNSEIIYISNKLDRFLIDENIITFGGLIFNTDTMSFVKENPYNTYTIEASIIGNEGVFIVSQYNKVKSCFPLLEFIGPQPSVFIHDKYLISSRPLKLVKFSITEAEYLLTDIFRGVVWKIDKI